MSFGAGGEIMADAGAGIAIASQQHLENAAIQLAASLASPDGAALVPGCINSEPYRNPGHPVELSSDRMPGAIKERLPEARFIVDSIAQAVRLREMAIGARRSYREALMEGH